MSNHKEELETPINDAENQEVEVLTEGEEPPRTGGGTGGPK